MNNDTAIYTAYDDHRGMDCAEAEKNLMRAILKGAMSDIRKQGEAGSAAYEYFSSEDDFYLFSFLSVCRHLDLCPRTIRTMVGMMDSMLSSQTIAA